MRLIQPLIVTVLLLRFRAGTVTYCVAPLKVMAPPDSPVVQLGQPTSVPVRLLPDASTAVVLLSRGYLAVGAGSVVTATVADPLTAPMVAVTAVMPCRLPAVKSPEEVLIEPRLLLELDQTMPDGVNAVPNWS